MTWVRAGSDYCIGQDGMAADEVQESSSWEGEENLEAACPSACHCCTAGSIGSSDRIVAHHKSPGFSMSEIDQNYHLQEIGRLSAEHWGCSEQLDLLLAPWSWGIF